jgi:hypothetical protein
MTETYASKTDAQWLAELSQEIDTLSLLRPDDQQRIIALARTLAERGMALPFIIAGARSSAEVLAELESAEPDPIMERPEVRRFIQENASPAGRPGTAIFRGKDVKRAERERLEQATLAAIRDARRSRGRHEIKKTRNVLMKIDQRELRQRLGREGDELCREINSILRSVAPLF